MCPLDAYPLFQGVLQIRAIPEDMEFYGKGPLLACKYMDSGVLWQRAEQIAEVLDEVELSCSPYK